MKNKVFYVQRVIGNTINATASRIVNNKRQWIYYDTSIECNHDISEKMWKYLLKSMKKRTLKLFRMQYD